MVGAPSGGRLVGAGRLEVESGWRCFMLPCAHVPIDCSGCVVLNGLQKMIVQRCSESCTVVVSLGQVDLECCSSLFWGNPLGLSGPLPIEFLECLIPTLTSQISVNNKFLSHADCVILAKPQLVSVS